MKITKRQLKQIIKEELSEAGWPSVPTGGSVSKKSSHGGLGKVPKIPRPEEVPGEAQDQLRGLIYGIVRGDSQAIYKNLPDIFKALAGTVGNRINRYGYNWINRDNVSKMANTFKKKYADQINQHESMWWGQLEQDIMSLYVEAVKYEYLYKGYRQ